MQYTLGRGYYNSGSACLVRALPEFSWSGYLPFFCCCCHVKSFCYESWQEEKTTSYCFFFSFLNLMQFILFFFCKLEYNIFLMLSQCLLYNEVNQLYVYVYIYPCPLKSPTHHHPCPSRSSQSIELSSLCLATCHQRSILHTVVCVFQPSLPFIPTSPSPHVHSLCLHLYSCPGNRFITTFFQISHMHVNILYLFLSF